MDGNNGESSGGDVDSPVTPTVFIEKEAGGASVDIDKGGGDENGAPQLSTQDSGTSLLSQFPPTQEMPRAVMQSPIPLPPGGGERERPQPEVDDAMRMSPPASAG